MKNARDKKSESNTNPRGDGRRLWTELRGLRHDLEDLAERVSENAEHIRVAAEGAERLLLMTTALHDRLFELIEPTGERDDPRHDRHLCRSCGHTLIDGGGVCWACDDGGPEGE